MHHSQSNPACRLNGHRSGGGRPATCAVLRPMLVAVLLSLVWVGLLRAQQSESESVVVLVRHAERAGDSASDPDLTARGQERAEALARMLADVGITRIHSTDTRRTRQTARPLADALGLEIESWNARDLGAMAETLLAQPGRHLVVGHSNTTDELAVALGGESHGSIVEAWEYDRLYFLTPGPDGTVTTVLVRYGPVSEP